MSKTKCDKCENIQDSPSEDMSYTSVTDLLLCDDCYTELRLAIAYQLDIELWEVNV